MGGCERRGKMVGMDHRVQPRLKVICSTVGEILFDGVVD